MVFIGDIFMCKNPRCDIEFYMRVTVYVMIPVTSGYFKRDSHMLRSVLVLLGNIALLEPQNQIF